MKDKAGQSPACRVTLHPGRGQNCEGAEPDSLVAPGSVPSVSPPTTPLGHYTHARHAALCVEAGLRRETLRQHVQVKLGHSILCARIVRPWITADGFSMWKLEVAMPSGKTTEASVPAFKVRQCSGLDGFCACAGEAGAGRPQADTAPASMPQGCADASNTAQTAHR